MRISMIAAMAKNRVIGKGNDMPWGMSMPADLKHFKAITTGKPVIMGRKTFESIGRPLPKRTNIVITRDANFTAEGVIVVNSPDEAINRAGDVEEVMIIGGGKIYDHFLPKTDRLYLTELDLTVEEFDTQFPDYSTQAEWHEAENEQHKADDKNAYDYCFITLDRV